MSTCFYSQRLIGPFNGVMQVISIEHGDAESSDGVNWILYVKHDDIVSHPGMSEVRYGSWSLYDGLKLSMVRGTETNNIIDRVGEALVKAVENNAATATFPLNDNFECWLLTEDKKPLVLIDSVSCEDDKQAISSISWHPGVSAYKEFHSEYGDAEKLRTLINARAGSRTQTVWVQRAQSDNGCSGDGITADGNVISAEVFPKRLLLEVWEDDSDKALVKDYLEWQAPWLLQLDHYNDDVRHTIELQAWLRPVLCAQQFRLFPKVLDEKQLKVTRVQARLMGYDSHLDGIKETFLHTDDKEKYV